MAITLRQDLEQGHPLAAEFRDYMRGRASPKTVLRASLEWCSGDLVLYAAHDEGQREHQSVTVRVCTESKEDSRNIYDLLLDAAQALIAGLPIHDRYWAE
jgi:hypothetical protein